MQPFVGDAVVAAHRRHRLDREIVGGDRSQARVVDPPQQAFVAPVEVAERVVEPARVGIRPLREQHVGLPGMDAQHVAGLDRHALRVERMHPVVVAHGAAGIPIGAPQVDQHAAPLQSGLGEPLDAQRRGPRECRRARLGRRRDLGADLHPSAIAVVVANLGNAVAVRVEHRAHVRERVPVRRELAVEEHRVVVEDVGVARVCVQVVFHAAVPHHRLQARRAPLEVVIVAARTVERERQAERPSGAHFGGGGAQPLGRDEVQAPALIIGPESPQFAPGGRVSSVS